MYYTMSLIQAVQEWLNGLLGNTEQGMYLVKAIMVVFTLLIYWFFYVIIFRIFNRLSRRVLREDSQIKALRIQKQEILSAAEVATIINRTVLALSWILRALILISAFNTLLGIFDFTEKIAQKTSTFVSNTVSHLFGSFVDYLPDLFTLLVIIGISYAVLHVIKLVFDGISRRRIQIPGFYPEWSKTSYNLIRLLIIALTVVLAFPYFPGSSSPAFQGVSLFFGILLSLGSTSAVANVVAGIVITYTRAFHIGDWVKLSNEEGKIIERTAFVTRIRTTKNVEVSIPNSAIMADKVINFSTQAKNSGIALHTGVTIGYDVPWPKVQQLLLSAAAATEHIVKDPKPFVLQTSLDDNYVAYELNAFTCEIDLRPRIYSELHANILDSFHSAGVEITSPHYRAMRDGNEPAMAPVIAPADEAEPEGAKPG